MNYLGEIWKAFRSTVRGFDTPHQLALGLSLGVWVGLLPKDSLIPYVLGAIAILTPGNLLCFGLGCLLGSLASPALDGITHPLGHAVLTYQPMQTTWEWLFQLPVVPWTRFENTVVTGNLVLGLIAALPIYFGFRTLSAWMGPKILLLFSKASQQAHEIDPSETLVPVSQEG